MKFISKVFVYSVVAIAIVGAFFSDLFEEIVEKFFYDDSILAVLCIVLIAITVLSGVFLVVYYDIPGLFQNYYRELCMKIAW